MTLKDFTFYLRHETEFPIAVLANPLFDDITLSGEKDKGIFAGIVQTMDTQFTFVGQDYERIVGIIESNARCIPIEFTVEYKNLPFYKGRILANSVTVDYLRCTAVASPTNIDEKDCFLLGYDVPVNIQEFEKYPVPIRAILGDIERFFVTGDGLVTPDDDPFLYAPSISPDDGWVVVNITSVCDSEAVCTFEINYSRIVQTTNCVGGVPVPPTADSILIENNCGVDGTAKFARPPQLAVFLDSFFDGFENVNSRYDFIAVELFYSQTADGQVVSYPNGIRLSTVITEFAGRCGLDVVSDFFGINGDGTAPENGEYEYAEQHLHRLLVFDKSDIKRPEATQTAFITNITPKQLFENLQAMFRTQIFINDGVFRIEHVSYFEQFIVTRDLTAEPERLVQGQGYSYDSSTPIPSSEVFKAMEAFGVDFVGLPITYPVNCIESTDKVDVVADIITTDLPGLASSLEQVSDDGIFLMAITPEDSVEFEIGHLSGEAQANGALSIANLQEGLWKLDRRYIEGNMNGVDESFPNYVRKRLQEVAIMETKPMEYVTQDWNGVILSTLRVTSAGFVQRVSYSARRMLTTLNLLHGYY